MAEMHGFTADYKRAAGQYNFILHDGTPLTAIAYPAALICSDIISAATEGLSPYSSGRELLLATADVSTLLVSSTWAVPGFPTSDLDPETRYKGALEEVVRGLFKGYPHLQEVITVDKVPPDSPVAPYTSQFKRTAINNPPTSTGSS